MEINKERIFISVLIVLSAFVISFSYNIETRALMEGTVQSGLVNYPDEFNLSHAISANSWSLPIQIISFLVKKNISALVISQLVLFTSTLMFLSGIYLTTKSLTGSALLAFLISFLIVLLKKNFGHLDYPTMMFTEHTNGLMAQALSTLIFGLLINNNLKLGFFFSVMLLSVHVTVGLWINSVIFFSLITRFKKYKNIIFCKENFIYIFLSSIIVLISFFYFFYQRIPIIYSYDEEIYKTYMKVWEDHRTAWGLYSGWINYEYITKTLILILLIFIFLRSKINKNNFNFGMRVLLINCILSFFLYINYKFFYFLFPDIVTRLMPTRFFLLHSIIGWPIIFSILYILIKSKVAKLNFNIKYTYYFFILIIVGNLLQHKSNFTERYYGIKSNLLTSKTNNKDEEFWNKIKTINLNGYLLTSSDICTKTVVMTKKPIYFCPEGLNFIPYFPHTAAPAKKIVEEVFNIDFDKPEFKNFGGIFSTEVQQSYEKKSMNDWKIIKNKFSITGLIVPKTWEIDLNIFSTNNEYNFYVIE